MRRELLDSILADIPSKKSGKTQNVVGSVGTLEHGGPDGAVPTKLFQPVPTSVPTICLRKHLNNNNVPTVPTVPTTKINSSASDAKTVPEASPSTSEHGWNGVGTEIDAEPDFTVYLDDPAFAQQVADERNAASVAAGRTDRYCACQKMATVAVGRGRVSPTNPEGVQRWLAKNVSTRARRSRSRHRARVLLASLTRRPSNSIPYPDLTNLLAPIGGSNPSRAGGRAN